MCIDLELHFTNVNRYRKLKIISCLLFSPMRKAVLGVNVLSSESPAHPSSLT